MIGVISEKGEEQVVREFFELFKTPWEFYQRDHVYDVVIITKDTTEEISAKVVIIYGSEKKRLDSEIGVLFGAQKQNTVLQWNNIDIPIYGQLSTLDGGSRIVARVKGTADPAVTFLVKDAKKIFRIGFNLFKEITFLLSCGQPAEFANIPTLELHISMLRNWVLNSGIPVFEIPPVPAGYSFITCLTHDVDFVYIQHHRFDHTMLGFVYRALFGSLIGFFKGRIAWKKLIVNWKAVFSLPGVYLGILDDFWIQFDRYMEVENGLVSTFFIIPFKNQPGKSISGRAPKRRAARYDIKDIESHVQRLVSNGFEIGVHGIDAWRDHSNAKEEYGRIARTVGRSDIGIRIHWLYFDNQSPNILEEAGFSYDSTFGYNDAIGFRAGTAQVFRPLGAERLLELPLQIQDTALFYTGRMGLKEDRALKRCKMLVRSIAMYGGVLVVNWHHRSIAPERLWGEFYDRLLGHLTECRAWFGTAQEVVRWFEKRRKAQFEDIELTKRGLKVKVGGHEDSLGPDLIFRYHKPRLGNSSDNAWTDTGNRFIDVPIRDNGKYEISL